MSVARADSTITPWDSTVLSHFADVRQHDDVRGIVDSRTFAVSGPFREVFFVVILRDIAKGRCTWCEVRPHQEHFSEAEK
jgi:hypothetical protein